ncbi:unnamed protein product, partial [Sphacelaria rigidula]
LPIEPCPSDCNQNRSLLLVCPRERWWPVPLSRLNSQASRGRNVPNILIVGLLGASAGLPSPVTVSLRGINPELGQTLASTGLTVWRAAEEMARFMWEYRR